MPVNATFGTVVYRDGGRIAVPVTFAENVSAPSKTVFQIARVSGAALMGIEYYLLGKGTAFELIFEVPPDRNGVFRVSAVGEVLKASGTWDAVTATATAKDVAYSTVVPEIVDYDIPANYVFGEKFYVLVAFNTPVTGWHLNNTLTEIWIEEGARIGTPTPYKWVGTDPPNIHATVPDPLPSDWQRLASPPGGHTGEWHGEEGTYFLMDWLVSEGVSGTFNLTLRPNNVLRGPVS